MPTGEIKKALRKKLRARRSKLTAAERVSKSAAIAKRLKRTAVYRDAATVMFYVTYDSEVMTDEMIEAALRQGKKVLVPVVNMAGDRKMSAVPITNLKNDLAIGNYGIREPRKGRPVAPEKIDLVIVPGIAFDLSGHRLGYGKGFYDTWMQKVPVERRVGLAYDVQVIPGLPKEVNDLPVCMIVTDKRTVKTKAQ